MKHAICRHILSKQVNIESSFNFTNVMLCAFWYHLHNLRKVEHIHGGVVLLLNSLKLINPPCVFFMFFKLYN